jgi:hypothetical protein
LIARYDAFVYLGPTTLTGLGRERRLARAAGRSVVTVFLGSEARPPYLSGYFLRPDGSAGQDMRLLKRQTAATCRRVRVAEATSTYVVNHPPTAQFHRQPFIDFTSLGIPTAASLAEPDIAGTDPDRVRIVHAPSMAPWKGTTQIRAAVAQLRDEGLPIEYIEIAGVPHSTVLETLAGADLVVDELYSDAILAGLATEAAWFGVTSLVFGYARPELEPIATSIGVSLEHYAEPDDLVDVLRTFVTSPQLRASVGASLRDFVRRERSPRAVAERYLRLLQDDPDPAWQDDPNSIGYVDGWGIDRAGRRAGVRRFVKSQGVGALRLPLDSPVRQTILREIAEPPADAS